MAAAVKPSSLIRISRYGFLVWGIFYGASRQVINQNHEDAHRAQREKERPAREAAKAAEKKKLYDAEMAYLAKETGAGGGGAAGGGGGGASK